MVLFGKESVMKQLNLNTTIKVKLTPYGADIFYHQYDNFLKQYPHLKETIKPRMPEIDENGFTEFQLWSFIEIFGTHIGMACKNVIEPIDIFLSEKDLEEVN